MAKAQLFHDQVMEFGPECLDLFIIPAWMDSVRKKNHDNILLKIHPYGCPGKPQVSNTSGGEVFS